MTGSISNCVLDRTKQDDLEINISKCLFRNLETISNGSMLPKNMHLFFFSCFDDLYPKCVFAVFVYLGVDKMCTVLEHLAGKWSVAAVHGGTACHL